MWFPQTQRCKKILEIRVSWQPALSLLIIILTQTLTFHKLTQARRVLSYECIRAPGRTVMTRMNASYLANYCESSEGGVRFPRTASAFG